MTYCISYRWGLVVMEKMFFTDLFPALRSEEKPRSFPNLSVGSVIALFLVEISEYKERAI